MLYLCKDKSFPVFRQPCLGKIYGRKCCQMRFLIIHQLIVSIVADAMLHLLYKALYNLLLRGMTPTTQRIRIRI